MTLHLTSCECVETVVAYMRETPTQEQRDRARASEMYNRGDMILAWVNEGDLLCLLSLGVSLDEEIAA